jgi:FKBP-type peptidyl-prolyl cis-trans isomerase
MKQRILFLGSLTLNVVLLAWIAFSSRPADETQKPAALESDRQKSSYLLGLRAGTGIHLQDSVDRDAAVRGFEDGFKGNDLVVDPNFITEANEALRRRAETRSMEPASRAFLAKNKNQQGWRTTPSGLQYKILKSGNGRHPSRESVVTFRSKTSLMDGTKVEEISRPPAIFRIADLPVGLGEGLQLMKPGARAALAIPPELAYGNQPRPGVPPDSVLVVDLELLSIK